MTVIDIEDLKPYQPAARFDVNSKGVFWLGVQHNGDEVTELPPLRLSDPINLIGRGIDQAGGHYRVMTWRDKVTRQEKTAALSMADIGTPAGFRFLQERGITVHSGRRCRERLTDYLQTEGADTVYSVTDRAGWHDGAYILPSGEVLPIKPARQGKIGKQAGVIYNGDTSQAAAYAPSGSLNEWQQQIARHAAGNSRLCLALGAAFAAPLLHLIGEQNGGFHLYGDSSDGKTTAARVALSVWGHPETLKLSWRGTDLGFSNAALARNDGLLVLDEIGEAEARTIGKTAYSVINGKTKTQAAKDGGNRPQAEWRTLLFSTGEYPLDSYMARAGQTWEAGQAVRLPSIPAAAAFGIYDRLHGFDNGAALSDHLSDRAAEQHGTAGRAWFERLKTLDENAIRAARDAFMATLPELNGQSRRVARRFAIVAAALELAADITGLPAGVGSAGVKSCFDAWLAANGTGKHEDRAIIKQATDFMQRYAFTPRFAAWDSLQDEHDRNHAGYFKPLGYSNTAGEAPHEYWIIPAVFESEICDGRPTGQACLVLHELGWLKRANGDRWQHQRKNKGRFYVLVGVEPPEADTEQTATEETDTNPPPP